MMPCCTSQACLGPPQASRSFPDKHGRATDRNVWTTRRALRGGEGASRAFGNSRDAWRVGPPSGLVARRRTQFASSRRGARPCPGANRKARRTDASAFTLLELLVVAGVIVVLLGSIAIALAGRGGEGASLTNAQSMVSSLIGATRAQAALHQTNARLIIYAQMPSGTTGDASKYLRALQVLRQETLANGNTVWVAAGDPVTLPAPICVVPPTPVPANHLNTGVTWNNNAATGPVSTLLTATAFSYRGQSTATVNQYFGAQNQSGRIHYIEFAADGTVTSNTTGNPTKVALAPAVLGINALPRFTNANSVRGLFVRRTGAVSLVNGANGF
jgi:type II secretory pathway pseudopilin PulG